jgi:predicted branched-subunit amino acid permease
LPEGSAFTGGARLIGVTAVGTFCWGAVTGLALVKVGLSAAQALGMVALVYSGTAQLAALPLIAAGASVAAVCAAALLANLRLWACSRSSRWSARCWSRGSP